MKNEIDQAMKNETAQAWSQADTRTLHLQAAEARAKGFYLRAADLYNEA
ncbi:MAG: hypothetical protein JWN99_115, partial [Ilumatobacteraceae bacterium]|nr:hypothetical protein [Ilumatobacteraceae bacterium]